MDDADALITYVTRKATSDIGSIFSAYKDETMNQDYTAMYYCMWGTHNVGVFAFIDNHLYLIMNTSHVDVSPRIDLADPNFDVEPLIGELRKLVREKDEQRRNEKDEQRRNKNERMM